MTRYKAEVVQGGRIKYTRYFNKKSHPRQVVRDIIQDERTKINYATIYIVNDLGFFWKYELLRRQDGMLVPRKMSVRGRVFDKDEVAMIFSDNIYMRELENGRN